MKQVAIVMPGLGEGHVKVAAAFSAKLKELVANVEITEYVGESVFGRSDGPFSRQCDLVVAVGTKCTMLASEIMKEEDMNVPLLSLSANGSIVFSPSVERYRHMTGVYPNLIPESIPLDAVFKVCGVARRVVLAYRIDEDYGCIELVVDDIKKYALKIGVLEVVSVCMLEGPLDAAYLSSVIQTNDVVIPVRGGRVTADIDVLAQICAERGAYFFSIANGKIPDTAVGGYVANIKYVGSRAAETIAPVLNDKIAVSMVSPVALKSTTQVVINTAVLAERGFSLSTYDEIFWLDDRTSYPVIYRTHYPLLSAQYVEQTRIATQLTWHYGGRRQGVECIPMVINASLESAVARKVAVQQALACRGSQVVVVDTEQMAYLLQQEMMMVRDYRSMVIIKSGDDQPAERASVDCAGWPRDKFIQRVILEPLQLRLWLDLLQNMVPRLRRIGVLYSCSYDELVPHLRYRLHAFERECWQRGLTLVHRGAVGGGQNVSAVCNELLENVDVIAGLPDLLTATDELIAAVTCFEENKRFVGSDLGIFGRGSAFMQPKYERVAEKILQVLQPASIGRRPADVGDIRISWLDLCL